MYIKNDITRLLLLIIINLLLSVYHAIAAFPSNDDQLKGYRMLV